MSIVMIMSMLLTELKIMKGKVIWRSEVLAFFSSLIHVRELVTWWPPAVWPELS